MNASSFVEVIRTVVYEPAVASTLETLRDGPVGRGPQQDLRQMAEWYNRLSDEDRERVGRVAEMSAFSAVFGFFAVLDGARQIDRPNDRGQITLSYQKEGKNILINDPDGEVLHDLFKAGS